MQQVNPKSSRLVLIDGNAIMHRAYHALPPLNSPNTGEPINAIYGLVSMLLRIVDDLKPSHLAVCFDRPEQTFRQKTYSKYQSQRPKMEDNLSSQFIKAKEVLDAMNIKVFEKAGFEADDVIGTLSDKARDGGCNEVIIVTGDRDILQLVDEARGIKVFMPANGLTKGKLFGEEEVKEKLGVTPSQIIDYKALVGDPSDNYPGVSGIGPKTAENLLLKYKTFDDIYKNIDEIAPNTKEKLVKGRELGELSYKLAKIIKDVELDIEFSDLANWDLAGPKVIDKFREIGFKTLLKRTLEKSGKVETLVNLKKNLSVNDIEKILKKVLEKLDSKIYAIRGTASLKLQGYDMIADDIDIICNEETADFINATFKPQLIKNVKYSQSDKFKSFFGQMVIDNVLVEIMGDWQIKNDKGMWSNKFSGKDEEVNVLGADSLKVRVTKPEIELDMFARMGRWNAFHKLKKEIASKNQTSLF